MKARKVRSTSKSPRRPARKPHSRPPTSRPAENPEAQALARRVASLASEKKAEDIVLLDVRGKTSYADYVVVASGDSERQVAATADHVVEELKKDGRRPLGSEGQSTGQWVLLDYGEVVVHLFLAEVRAFYDLDGLWADAPRERHEAQA